MFKRTDSGTDGQTNMTLSTASDSEREYIYIFWALGTPRPSLQPWKNSIQLKFFICF